MPDLKGIGEFRFSQIIFHHSSMLLYLLTHQHVNFQIVPSFCWSWITVHSQDHSWNKFVSHVIIFFDLKVFLFLETRRQNKFTSIIFKKQSFFFFEILKKYLQTIYLNFSFFDLSLLLMHLLDSFSLCFEFPCIEKIFNPPIHSIPCYFSHQIFSYPHFIFISPPFSHIKV